MRLLIDFINMPENELAEMGERGRVYALKHHDYEVLAHRFIKIAEQKK